MVTHTFACTLMHILCPDIEFLDGFYARHVRSSYANIVPHRIKQEKFIGLNKKLIYQPTLLGKIMLELQNNFLNLKMVSKDRVSNQNSFP